MKNHITKTLILILLTLWLGMAGVTMGYALTFSEVQKPQASDGATRDFFGNSVSIAGNTTVDETDSPLAGEVLAIVTNISFDFDSAQLLLDAMQKLERVLNLLRANEAST